jgi:hypothetical protein
MLLGFPRKYCTKISLSYKYNRKDLTLSLTAHLMSLISLQSYKLAPPPKDDTMQIEDDSDDVSGADL